MKNSPLTTRCKLQHTSREANLHLFNQTEKYNEGSITKRVDEDFDDFGRERANRLVASGGRGVGLVIYLVIHHICRAFFFVFFSVVFK